MVLFLKRCWQSSCRLSPFLILPIRVHSRNSRPKLSAFVFIRGIRGQEFPDLRNLRLKRFQRTLQIFNQIVRMFQPDRQAQ